MSEAQEQPTPQTAETEQLLPPPVRYKGRALGCKNKQTLFPTSQEYFKNYYQTKVKAIYDDPANIIKCEFCYATTQKMNYNKHKRTKICQRIQQAQKSEEA